MTSCTPPWRSLVRPLATLPVRLRPGCRRASSCLHECTCVCICMFVCWHALAGVAYVSKYWFLQAAVPLGARRGPFCKDLCWQPGKQRMDTNWPWRLGARGSYPGCPALTNVRAVPRARVPFLTQSELVSFCLPAGYVATMAPARATLRRASSAGPETGGPEDMHRPSLASGPTGMTRLEP